MSLRIIIRPTQMGGYYAQAVEHDIAAFAGTLDELKTELVRIFQCHVAVCKKRGLVPFECLNPAPPEFEDLFNKGIPLDMGLSEFSYESWPTMTAAVA